MGAAASAAAISSHDLEPTDIVKGAGRLGSGVYKLRTRGALRVAVKELRADLSGALSARDAEALQAEAVLQTRLAHDAVVRVYGVARDERAARVGVAVKAYECVV